MEDIFYYTDYRQYLKDFYNWRKKKDSFFSYRFFAGKVKIDSGTLVKVLNGAAHITPNNIPFFIHIAKLKGREAEYFESLVLFNRARRASEIQVLWEKLCSLKGVPVKTINSSQFEFYYQWYYTVIREWIGHHKWDGDYSLLARSLQPPISKKKAKEAILLLTNLKMIQWNQEGYWEQCESFITSVGSLEKKAIRKFQTDTMKLAIESLETIPPNHRNISTLSLSISKEDLPEINERILKFRRSLMHLTSETDNPDMVYQLNIQLFPTTREKEDVE